MFDLLLKNVCLRDPANNIAGVHDIAIEDGKIADIQKEISPAAAKKNISFDGALAIPGIIDLHVHLCGNFGNQTGFSMLARSGVCTALNMSGPTTDLLDHMPQAHGLNIATLEDATPGRSLSSKEPSEKEAGVFTDQAIANLRRAKEETGLWILGGLLPPVSYRNASYMHNQISGIRLSQEILDRYYHTPDKDQAALLGVSIVLEISQKIAPWVDGYYLMTPFKRIDLIQKIVTSLSSH